MKNKPFYIIASILILGLTCMGAYAYFHRQKEEVDPNTPLPSASPSEPKPSAVPAAAGIEQLSEYPARDLFLDSNGILTFLNQENLTWYTLDPATKQVQATKALLDHEPHSVSYRSDGKLVASSYYDEEDEGYKTIVQSLEGGEQTVFPNLSEGRIVSDSLMLSMEEVGEEHWITSVNLKTGASERVVKTEEPFILSPDPKGERIIAYPEPEGYGDNRLYLVDIKSKSLQLLPNTGAAIGATWSPDGAMVATTNINPNTLVPTISFIDPKAFTLRKSSFTSTSQKIVWKGNSTISGFSPRQNPENVFLYGAVLSDEDLYEIKLDSNSSTVLFKTPDNEHPFSVDELIFDSSRTSYYAISNQRLFRITP
jgi:hypothetical protein